MTAEAQKFNDMLAVLQQQRDQALNALVMSQAENVALHRRIAELQKVTDSTNSGNVVSIDGAA